MMLHAIDLHKHVLPIASLRADGEEVLRAARIPASREALRACLARWVASGQRVAG